MLDKKKFKRIDGQCTDIRLGNIFLNEKGNTNFATVLSHEPCQPAGNVGLSTKLIATALKQQAIRVRMQNKQQENSSHHIPPGESSVATFRLRNAYRQNITGQGVLFAATLRNKKAFPGWPGSSRLIHSFDYYFGTLRRTDSIKSFIFLKYIL